MLNPIFSKKVQGQKHPGRWGIALRWMPWASVVMHQSWSRCWLSIIWQLIIKKNMVTQFYDAMGCHRGPFGSYVQWRVAHAPGMQGTFPHHQIQRKPLVRDPGMNYGTCVRHVSWCISGSLTRGGMENVPGACAIRNFTYLVRAPWVYWWRVASTPLQTLSQKYLWCHIIH